MSTVIHISNDQKASCTTTEGFTIDGSRSIRLPFQYEVTLDENVDLASILPDLEVAIRDGVLRDIFECEVVPSSSRGRIMLSNAIFTQNEQRMVAEDVLMLSNILGLTMLPVDTINSENSCTATVEEESSIAAADDDVQCVVVNGGMDVFIREGASIEQEEVVKSTMRASIQEGMVDGTYVDANDALRIVTLRPEVEFAASDGAGLNEKTSGRDSSSIWIGTIVGVVVLVVMVLALLGYSRKREREAGEEFSEQENKYAGVGGGGNQEVEKSVTVYDLDDNNELEVEYNNVPVGDEP